MVEKLRMKRSLEAGAKEDFLELLIRSLVSHLSDCLYRHIELYSLINSKIKQLVIRKFA